MTRLVFTPHGWGDYVSWQTVDRKMLKRLNSLIAECLRTPTEGTGKPEPLRHEGPGIWSRRITQEHRLVYHIGDDAITVVQARFHY